MTKLKYLRVQNLESNLSKIQFFIFLRFNFMRAISTINDISNACEISKIQLAKDTFSYLEILF
jgi:hypothetical protein